jgi:DNA-binding transcriptional LysR family regulator
MLFIDDMQEAHDRNLAGIDLNLLVVLDALLAERHVTRAASRVGLTQSAASHALARLRALLGDPILVRGAGGQLVATERARALAPQLRRSLDDLAIALRGEPPFDPSTARRTFRIAAADYAELILLPPLLERLAGGAPGVDLWVVQMPDDPARALAAGEIDAAIGVWPERPWPAGTYQKRLFDDHFRCVVRAGHPAAKQRMTLARFCELPQLLVAPRGTPGSFVDTALERLGRSRRIALAVPHFLVAPHLIAASDLVVTLATRVARVFAEPFGLVLLPPPVELPGFTHSLVWHERGHRDAGQRWLRDQLVAVSSSLGR